MEVDSPPKLFTLIFVENRKKQFEELIEFSLIDQLVYLNDIKHMLAFDPGIAHRALRTNLLPRHILTSINLFSYPDITILEFFMYLILFSNE